MAALAQLVELLVVVQAVMGSSPISRPTEKEKSAAQRAALFIS